MKTRPIFKALCMYIVYKKVKKSISYRLYTNSYLLSITWNIDICNLKSLDAYEYLLAYKILTFVLKNLTTFSLSSGFLSTSTAFMTKETGCKRDSRRLEREHFWSLEQQIENMEIAEGKIMNATINHLMSWFKDVE